MGDDSRNVREVLEQLLALSGALTSRDLAAALGMTRQTAHAHLRTAVAEGFLVREGKGRGVRYLRAQPGDVHLSFAREGLEEDQVWRDLDRRAALPDELDESSRSTLNYIVTEVLNNAIDHSQGTRVDIRFSHTEDRVSVDVEDDGIGAFRHVRERLKLRNDLEAIQEISKGKVTTDPEHHTGEGLFFVSKAANLFEMQSGEFRWIVDNDRRDHAIASEPARVGTQVCIELARRQARSLEEIFREYTEDFEFSRTRAVVKLFEHGTRFVSRSEAKRLLLGVERFKEVILDFRGIRGVGQGFADEIFRVWASAHPEVRLVPEGMNESVAFMVRRAMRPGSQ